MENPADLSILVLEGPSQGQSISLQQPQTVLGRETGSQVDITFDSPGVSRQHARITFEGDQVYLEDLASSNGTFLNDARLSTEPVALSNGDVVRLGRSVRLRIQLPTAAREAPSPDFVPETNVAATIAAEVYDMRAGSAPPEILVSVAGGKTQTYSLARDSYTIGRSEENDIVIDSKIISRAQAHLARSAVGFRFVPNPDASNPVYLNNRPLTDSRELSHGDILRIGGLDPGLMVTMTYQIPGVDEKSREPLSIQFGEKDRLRIGRDPSNDIVLRVPTVSRFHAQVEREAGRYRVRDLDSANGTFIDGTRVVAESWLNPGDSLRIGPYRFALAENALTQYDDSGGLQVDALKLNKWVSKDLNILQDISLAFKPREFIVVVGQSGGGKSTLIDAISGYRPATDGRVFVNEIDIYRHFDAIRTEIGYVPQRDIIHMELTVYQALDYAAQLRMPADTSPDERHERIMEVLADLDLTHRKDVQISGLSGGQQKRVSIGVELLTRPSLFYLDEPTSGLDPGTETALMHLMRRLSDQGRTIVLITHATKNVMLADRVVFLARGGYLVWFGPPAEALAYFDPFRSEDSRQARPMEFDDIYAILEQTDKGDPQTWAQRFRENPAYEKYIASGLRQRQDDMSSAPARDSVAAISGGGSRRQVSGLRQFLILSSRNLRILTRDRFSLILMLAAAPLVGMLGALLAFLLGRTPFDYNDGSIGTIGTVLFMLTIYGVMVGGLAQMREIVKENEVYKRERLVNLKIFPYVLSKVWVAGLLAIYAAAWYVLIHYLAFEMPGGTIELVLIFITVVLTTLAGMMLGLFASALSPTPNAVPLLVILLMLPQFVLGGALIPLPGYVTAPMSTRWGFEGLMAITGVGSDVAADLCWQLDDELRRAMTIEDKTQRCSCMGTNVLHEESCYFPGLGIFYNEAVDQPPPQEPPPLQDPPPEPEIPQPPQEPEDQSDNVAVAAYLNDLQAYQATVESIQEEYKSKLNAYQAEADIYAAEVVSYQEALITWQISRAAAIEPAEGTINQVLEKFGWTFVDKEDDQAFLQKVGRTWLAQLIIITILFIGILILQKRKDVI